MSIGAAPLYLLPDLMCDGRITLEVLRLAPDRVEHAGHMTPVEAPDQVTAALRNWLEWPA